MAADWVLQKTLGKKYEGLSESTKKRVIFPLIGLSMAGLAVARQAQQERRERIMRDE